MRATKAERRKTDARTERDIVEDAEAAVTACDKPEEWGVDKTVVADLDESEMAAIVVLPSGREYRVHAAYSNVD